LNSERSSLFTDGLAELQLQAAKEKKEASLASSTFGRKSKTDKVNAIVTILFILLMMLMMMMMMMMMMLMMTISLFPFPSSYDRHHYYVYQNITFLFCFLRRRSLHHHYKD
jgi:phosphate starvation-inducible membrane PsiE